MSIFRFVLFFLVFPCAWAQPVKEYHLENGLTVVLDENKKAPLVSIDHFVKAGSLHEKPGITGIAHLFEYMMFRPVRSDEKGFFEKIGELGGDANAATRFESTFFMTTVPARNLQKTLYLESDRFMNLKVTDALLALEKQAVASEYSTKFDNNALISLWLSVYRSAYSGHPFGWTIVGEREDLEKIKASDCNAFFSKFYRPQNTGIFISGDFDAKRVLTWIKEYYGGWEKTPASGLPETYRHETEYTQAQSPLAAKSRNVMVGFRFPEYTPQNSLPMLMGSFILLESSFSLSHRRLVLDKKIASSVSAFNFWDDNGLMKAMVTVEPSVELAKIVEEITSLASDLESLSETEWNAYVTEFETTVRESMLRNDQKTVFLARSWGKWGDLNLVLDLSKQLKKIPRSEVTGLIKKYWTRTNLVAVTNAGGLR